MSALLLHSAKRYARDNISRQQEVYHKQRQHGQRQPHVDRAEFRLVDIPLEQADHDRQGVLALVREEDERHEQVVPARHEGEDRLSGDRRNHDRQDDAVEGVELARAVDPRCLHHLDGQRREQILPHEEHDRRRCDGRQDERQEAVGPVQLVHHLVEADRARLGRNHHDEHDEGEERLAHPPVVGDQGISGQRREVDRADRREARDDQRVEKALERIEALAEQHVQIGLHVDRRQQGKAALDFRRGAGGVDEHDPEGQDAQQRQDDADDINDCFVDAKGDSRAFLKVGHALHPPCRRFSSFIPIFSRFFGFSRIAVAHEVEQQGRQHGRNDEHDHAGGSGAVVHVAALERLTVDEHGGRQRRVVRPAVQEQLRNVEQLQAADHRCDQRIEHDRPQARQRHAEKDLPSVRPVDGGGLEQRGVDAHDACDEDDHRVAVPHPELDERDDSLRRRLVLQVIDGSVDPAERLQQAVDRSHRIREQRVEQDGDRARRNDVRHVEQHFEYALPPHLRALAREPGGEQQRQQHLGNEVENPDEGCVGKRLAEGDVVEEKIPEVLERLVQEMDRLRDDSLHIRKPDDRGIQNGIEREYQERKQEWQAEQIAEF
ncbi:hypothetical protein BN871_BF_00410 [Paenibacillus sp. P22]|nr:hypothetical protein BN871_BF_00410 [Paenibacillus sp. P22]